ncbi:hypothetical protein PIB30_058410 [Stylosanthes scabra]|uniref:Uncharacterized protein n=1 Tax=Stylosanthes scabra TaxID=79078 RepID=A0ABU6SKX3_9FABA|nr:hypothetical protein [Stylosanthes scabra]
MAEAIARTPEDLKEVEIRVRRSTEDGATAKGKVEDDDMTDQKRDGCVGDVTGGAMRSAEVDAFAKEKRITTMMEDRAMPVEDAAATVEGGATKMRGSSGVGVVDDGTRSSAEVGASVREK